MGLHIGQIIIVHDFSVIKAKAKEYHNILMIVKSTVRAFQQFAFSSGDTSLLCLHYTGLCSGLGSQLLSVHQPFE